MVAARTVGGLVHPGTIEELERDLTKVIEDFDRAVNVEPLRRVKETDEHLFPRLDFRAAVPASTSISEYYNPPRATSRSDGPRRGTFAALNPVPAIRRVWLRMESQRSSCSV